MTDLTIRKNAKATKTRWEKKQQGRQQWTHLSVRFKYGVKNSDRNSQTWTGHRSNATCSHYSCNVYPGRNRFLVVCLDGWRIGEVQLTSIVSLCVGLSTPIFTFIGKAIFWSCDTDFGPKMSPTKDIVLSFLGYLGEIESHSPTVWTCICTIVPRSVVPFFLVRIYSGWRDSLWKALSAFGLGPSS